MLTSREIEEQIQDYKLSFIQLRDQRTEWEMRFPMFVETFHRMVSVDNVVPSQDAFVIQYFRENAEMLESVMSDQQLKRGLEARIRRSYPSFVRDLHFSALLKERGLEASYDRKTDISAGVDHILEYKSNTFYIHCFVNTRLGKLGRAIKARRHDFQGIHLDIVIDMASDSAREVGDFFLYSDDHIDFLIEAMEKAIKDDEG